jgi:hypothetical protein
MASEREMQEMLSSYLGGRVSVNGLANWLDSQLSSIRFSDNALFDLAAGIQNNLEMYFDNLLDEQGLRDRLSAFGSGASAIELHFVFDDPPAQSIKPERSQSAWNSQNQSSQPAFV